MDYVIDIQGFRDVEDRFMMKEVACLALDHNYVGHWIAAPPHSFGDLTCRAKVQNNWLSCYYHGLEWFEGDVQYKHLQCTLREIARSARRIFARGQEKTKLLQQITSRQIINLEDIACPSFKKLPASNCYCFHHGVRKEEYFACALNHAAKAKIWLKLHQGESSTYTSAKSTSTQRSLPAVPSNGVVEKQKSSPSSLPQAHVCRAVPPYYEQPTSVRDTGLATIPDEGCVLGGSDSSGVDETDNHSCEHR